MLNVVPKACLMVKYYYFVNLESILICIEFMGGDKGGDCDSHILTHSHTLSLRDGVREKGNFLLAIVFEVFILISQWLFGALLI